MNLYEHLQNEACEDGIDVINYDFKSENIKGLYFDGTIAIRQNIDTTTEKACVLSEELGHHYTTVGDIIELDTPYKRKQEQQARFWAYNRLIGLYGLIRAYEHGCTDRHEIAEFLEVTDEFLSNAVEYYRNKYGVGKVIDNYYISFIPSLQIMKRFFSQKDFSPCWLFQYRKWV